MLVDGVLLTLFREGRWGNGLIAQAMDLSLRLGAQEDPCGPKQVDGLPVREMTHQNKPAIAIAAQDTRHRGVNSQSR